MRIIHTADWHMGLRLGSVDRRDDLTRAIRQVADICRAETADVLLVCGDLFDGSTRPDLVAYWTGLLATTFREFLSDGGTIVALTGNHDNENLAQSLRHSFSLADPTVAKAGGLLRPGRFHLFAGPTFFRLADRRTPSHEVQFIVMPSPTVARYKLGDAPASGEDRNRALKAAFRRTLDGMPVQPGYDLARPTVLAAHIPTAGAEIRDGVTVAQVDAGGVTFADGELPTAYAYVALGDLHRPQCLMGLDHVRYSGSIDRMDAGESADAKSVAVFDVGPAGLTGPVRLVPLVATTIHHVVVDDPQAQMPTLADRYPDRETALVKLTVRHRAGRDHLLDLLTELDGLFPRCYARDCQETSADAATAISEGKAGTAATAASTVEDTVHADDRKRLSVAFRERQAHADRLTAAHHAATLALSQERARQDGYREAITAAAARLPAGWPPDPLPAGAELSALAAEADELDRQGVPTLHAELTRARAEVLPMDEQVAHLRSDLDDVPAEARRPVDAVEADLSDAREARGRCRADQQRAQAAHDELTRRRDARRQLEIDCHQLTATHHHLSVLADMLDRTGLQLHLMRRAEHQIVGFANAVLDRLSDGGLVLQLRADGDGAERALDLVAVNRRTAGAGGDPLNVAFLSGSQQFRVAVALALAVGQYAGGGHRLGDCVIIDEGFGSLDAGGQAVMIQELHRLTGIMKRVILVSHQESFADAFQHGYRFALDETGSTRVTPLAG